MGEEWREVYGFDILIEVSNRGNVRTKHYPGRGYRREYRDLHPLDNGHGYLRIVLPYRGKERTVYIHQLVAEYFLPNPWGYSEINHKDENKTNNSADNLEWCTHKYNANYGTAKERSSAKQRRRIRCINNNIVYGSLEEAAQAVGVGKTAISNCLNGRTKSCAGYKWSYADVEAV